MAPLPAREKYRWLTIPTAIVMVVLPVAILTTARSSDLLGLLLAYVNALIISIAIIYFLTRRTYEAVIPVLFLSWIIFSWPIATIYFGIFSPDATYITTSEAHRLFLQNNLLLQAVLFVFLVAYLSTLILLQPRGGIKLPRFSQQNPATWKLAYVATGISIVAFAGGLFARVTVNYETATGYLMSGLFNYLFAVPFIIGVLYPKISRSVRFFILAFFALSSPVYLLYHSRFNMLVPWVMIVFGLLLFGEWPARKKAILAITCVAVFPFLILLGEVTRSASTSNAQTLEEKAEILGRWQEFFSQNSMLGQTMGRLFSTGGHSIITMTPEEVDYLEFNPLRYGAEMAIAIFVPGKIYSDYYYSTTYHLNNYGLRVVIGGTSVELSLPGSLWMLGGWLPTFFGAIITALLHLAVMYWLRAANRKSVYKGLFYLGMMAGVIVWGSLT